MHEGRAVAHRYMSAVCRIRGGKEKHQRCGCQTAIGRQSKVMRRPEVMVLMPPRSESRQSVYRTVRSCLGRCEEVGLWTRDTRKPHPPH